ncbi:MAG: ATP-dependent 6-phosphofructokinase [Candidatus Buchananbacteria bacterium]
MSIRKKRLAILTGGGPAPGFNAVIYGAAKAALDAGWEVLGIRDGWKGVLDGRTMELDYTAIEGIQIRGGTILGTSRTNLAKVKVGKQTVDKIAEGAGLIREMGLDALIANGGEDTISVAERLWQEHQIPVICTPKTIDGDVCGTERTYGLDTAANWVGRAIAGLHEDFASTHYVAVVEVMGRKAGWLPLYGGIAGGAHMILVPEFPRTIEDICQNVARIYKQFGYCIIAVAEELNMDDLAGHISESGGADNFGHAQIALREKGWAKVIADEIVERIKLGARPVVLGHAQRGGPPSAFDVAMCLQLGQTAFTSALHGVFGKLISWQGEKPVPVDLALAGGGKTRQVPRELYEALIATLP